tara:strand:+ start:1077 stop:1826 length:750 start_codon:yes stop_codon:yes gene_type:complete
MGLTQVEKEGIETLINNNADNKVITGSGTANTLEGEANLTFDGTSLEVVGSNGKLILRHAGTNATKIASLNNAGDGVADLVFETFNKETAKIHSGGNFEISDGNLVVASGHGIDFSATANTGTSELFADYEEGAWSINPHDGTCTTTSGKYRLIGQQVTVWAKASGFSDTSTNDMIKLKGLPYSTSSSWAGAAGAAMIQNVGQVVPWVAFAEDDHIKFYGSATGTFEQLRHNELSSGHEIYFCATYPIG